MGRVKFATRKSSQTRGRTENALPHDTKDVASKAGIDHEASAALGAAIGDEIGDSVDPADLDRLRRALVNVDLQSIVLAWSDLPVDVRYQIVALVQAEQWKRQATQVENGIPVK